MNHKTKMIFKSLFIILFFYLIYTATGVFSHLSFQNIHTLYVLKDRIYWVVALIVSVIILVISGIKSDFERSN